MSDTTAHLTGAEDVAWDLSELYSGDDDAKIGRDLDAADGLADKLAADYRGKVAGLDAELLRDLVARYEEIAIVAHKLGAYAQLHWSTNAEDPARGALLQRIDERSSRLQQKLVFLELEWAEAPDEQAKKLIADPVLKPYKHWLEVVRLRRPYLLTEPEEKILAEKSVTGRSAWARFFNETFAASRYDWEGEQVPQETVLNKLFEQDREVRRRAAEAFTEGLKKNARAATYVFNTVLADKASDDRLRGYPSWITSRNMANEVDDASVDALVNAVTARYDLVARYYRLKGKLLGLGEMFDYDRYAPLPAADHEYRWDEGRSIVLDAYGKFHPRMAEIAGEFFDKRWIDAPVRPGKTGGAYAMPMTPDLHPYVLLNYEARTQDVMTLAHELGHGVHQYLSRKQGMLESDTPLTTAETASVFGEMLVFQSMMAQEKDPAVRLAMLTRKLEDTFATVFRQVAMNRFEDAIHTARREQGELTTKQYGELWLKSQNDMFQGSVTMTDNYGSWWEYIYHFVNVPGYVYAYSFGELLVLALYARYEQVGPAFADDYLAMLTAGGSDWPHEIVKPLGVDLTDPGFWKHGLAILDEMVTQAEKLAAQVK